MSFGPPSNSKSRKRRSKAFISASYTSSERVRRSARQQMLSDVLSGNAAVSVAKRKYAAQFKSEDKMGFGNLERRGTHWLKKLLREGRPFEEDEIEGDEESVAHLEEEGVTVIHHAEPGKGLNHPGLHGLLKGLKTLEREARAASDEDEENGAGSVKKVERLTDLELQKLGGEAQLAHKRHDVQNKMRAAAYRLGGLDMQWLFSRKDIDSNGELDRHEFLSLVRKELRINASTVSDKEVQMVFEYIDLDWDETLTLDELVTFMKTPMVLNVSKRRAVQHGQLSEAARNGDVPRVTKLLQRSGGQNIDERDANGSTALMHAVWYGHLEVVKYLCRHGCDVNALNTRKSSALYHACEQGREEVIIILLAHGASKSLKVKNTLGKCPEDFTDLFKHIAEVSAKRATQEQVRSAKVIQNYIRMGQRRRMDRKKRIQARKEAKAKLKDKTKASTSESGKKTKPKAPHDSKDPARPELEPLPAPRLTGMRGACVEDPRKQVRQQRHRFKHRQFEVLRQTYVRQHCDGEELHTVDHPMVQVKQVLQAERVTSLRRLDQPSIPLWICIKPLKASEKSSTQLAKALRRRESAPALDPYATYCWVPVKDKGKHMLEEIIIPDRSQMHHWDLHQTVSTKVSPLEQSKVKWRNSFEQKAWLHHLKSISDKAVTWWSGVWERLPQPNYRGELWTQVDLGQVVYGDLNHRFEFRVNIPKAAVPDDLQVLRLRSSSNDLWNHFLSDTLSKPNGLKHLNCILEDTLNDRETDYDSLAETHKAEGKDSASSHKPMSDMLNTWKTKEHSFRPGGGGGYGHKGKQLYLGAVNGALNVTVSKASRKQKAQEILQTQAEKMRHDLNTKASALSTGPQYRSMNMKGAPSRKLDFFTKFRRVLNVSQHMSNQAGAQDQEKATGVGALGAVGPGAMGAVVEAEEEITLDEQKTIRQWHEGQSKEVRPTTAHRTALATAAYMRHVEKNQMLPVPVNIITVHAEEGGKSTKKAEPKPSEVHMSMAGRLLGDKGIGAVAMMLPSAKPSLVNLCDNRLTVKGMKTLVPKLGSHILTLNLSKNNLGNPGASELSRGIQSLPLLEVLDLGHCMIGERGVSDLAQSLLALSKGAKSRLRWLLLTHNNAGNQGGLDIAHFLGHHNCSLKAITLAWNNIHSQSAIAILKALRRNQTLAEADLAWNQFGGRKNSSSFSTTASKIGNKYLNSGSSTSSKKQQSGHPDAAVYEKSEEVTAIAALFLHNSTLRHLNLGFNNIQAKDFKALSKSLLHNHTLCGLHMAGNEIGITSLGYLYVKTNHESSNSTAVKSLSHASYGKHDPLTSGWAGQHNCWVCQDWHEFDFVYHKWLSTAPDGPDAADFEPDNVFLCLEAEGWRPVRMQRHRKTFVLTRMLSLRMLQAAAAARTRDSADGSKKRKKMKAVALKDTHIRYCFLLQPAKKQRKGKTPYKVVPAYDKAFEPLGASARREAWDGSNQSFFFSNRNTHGYLASVVKNLLKGKKVSPKAAASKAAKKFSKTKSAKPAQSDAAPDAKGAASKPSDAKEAVPSQPSQPLNAKQALAVHLPKKAVVRGTGGGGTVLDIAIEDENEWGQKRQGSLEPVLRHLLPKNVNWMPMPPRLNKWIEPMLCRKAPPEGAVVHPHELKAVPRPEIATSSAAANDRWFLFDRLDDRLVPQSMLTADLKRRNLEDYVLQQSDLEDEYENLVILLEEGFNYQCSAILRQIFKHYAASYSGQEPFTLSRVGFVAFQKDCLMQLNESESAQLHEDEESVATDEKHEERTDDTKQYLTGIDIKEIWHKMMGTCHSLTRAQFLEMVVHATVALGKKFSEDLSQHWSVCQSVEHCLEHYILPRAHRVNPQDFRDNIMHCKEVHDIIEDVERPCKALFLSVVGVFASERLEAKDNESTLITLPRYLHILQDLHSSGNNDLLCDMQKQRLSFVLSTCMVEDEGTTDRHTKMSFKEFLEAICRVAYYQAQELNDGSTFLDCVEKLFDRSLLRKLQPHARAHSKH